MILFLVFVSCLALTQSAVVRVEAIAKGCNVKVICPGTKYQINKVCPSASKDQCYSDCSCLESNSICCPRFNNGCTSDRVCKKACVIKQPCYGPEYHCLVDPCYNAKCPAQPGATCVANYCGGCKAEFYDENCKLVKCNV